MPKRKLTEIELENFEILLGTLVRMADLMQSPSFQMSEVRRIINSFYSCAKPIGGTVLEAVEGVIEAFMAFAANPSQTTAAEVHLKVVKLREDIAEL